MSSASSGPAGPANVTGPTSTAAPVTGMATGRRSWRRRLVAAAALLTPILELAVLIQVGARLGVGPTLLLLLAAAVAGSLVLRHVGADAIRRLTAAGRGEPVPAPTRPAAGTVLLVLAGVLLILPGFLSDVAGLVLLLPAVRGALARRAGEAVLRRFPVHTVRVVQGTVVGEGGVPVDVQVTQVRTAPPRILPPPS
jgi:UPF0716 protein FxsA